jgi:hypothetical protein
MQKYDLYIGEKKPGIGLYVRNGSDVSPRSWLTDAQAAPLNSKQFLICDRQSQA